MSLGARYGSSIYRLSKLAAGAWPASHPSLLSLLEITAKLDRSELLRDQLLHLQKLLEHAHDSVPFYGSRLAEVRRIALGELTLERFRENVPILTRELLRDSGSEMVSRATSPAHRPNGVKTTTSGSTGRPITSEGSHVSGALAAAQQDRFHRWHGRDPNLPAAFITKAEVSERSERLSHWTLLGRGRALHFPLSRPVSEQLAWLEREKSAYLVSYSSNVRALARLALELGVALPGLRDVTVSSEPVTGDLRELVRRAWGAKLVATYSANEVGGIALQGPSGDDYLVQAEFVLVEILGRDGMPSLPGEVGRVVVTALHEAHRPLIRYELGDFAEAAPEASGALGLPVLRRVLGRERNMLVLPDGGEVWPYFEMGELEGLRALRQWQLVQRSPSAIEVRMVVGRPLDAGEEAVVRGVVERSLPGHFDVTLRAVDSIPRGAGGKYEEFVCALDRDDPLSGSRGG